MEILNMWYQRGEVLNFTSKNYVIYEQRLINKLE
jgi:hypothetical protein